MWSNKVKVAFIISLVTLVVFIVLSISSNQQSGAGNHGMQPMGAVFMGIIEGGFI